MTILSLCYLHHCILLLLLLFLFFCIILELSVCYDMYLTKHKCYSFYFSECHTFCSFPCPWERLWLNRRQTGWSAAEFRYLYLRYKRAPRRLQLSRRRPVTPSERGAPFGKQTDCLRDPTEGAYRRRTHRFASLWW